MKKLLGLTVAALLVMGLVGGGTWAYFSDVETSTENTLSAGTLDLTLAGGNDDVQVLETNVGNVAPGDSYSDSAALANVGTLDGELDISIGTMTNDDNGLTDPEGDFDDTGGADGGELGANAWMAVWLDYEDGGGWSADDVGLKSDATTYTHAAATEGTATGGSTTTVVDATEPWTADAMKGRPVTVTGKGTGVVVSNTTTTLTVATPFTSAVVDEDIYSIASGPLYDLINNYGGDIYNAAVATMQETGTTGDNYDFVIEWVIPITVGNIIQSDSVSFDITFTLEQAEAD